MGGIVPSAERERPLHAGGVKGAVAPGANTAKVGISWRAWPNGGRSRSSTASSRPPRGGRIPTAPLPRYQARSVIYAPPCERGHPDRAGWGDEGYQICRRRNARRDRAKRLLPRRGLRCSLGGSRVLGGCVLRRTP